MTAKHEHYITEPPCAFIEAVVAGYSPIDRWTCHFARIATKLRAEPWWSKVRSDLGVRGEVESRHPRHGRLFELTNETAGEIPWR